MNVGGLMFKVRGQEECASIVDPEHRTVFKQAAKLLICKG